MRTRELSGELRLCEELEAPPATARTDVPRLIRDPIELEERHAFHGLLRRR